MPGHPVVNQVAQGRGIATRPYNNGHGKRSPRAIRSAADDLRRSPLPPSERPSPPAHCLSAHALRCPTAGTRIEIAPPDRAAKGTERTHCKDCRPHRTTRSLVSVHLQSVRGNSSRKSPRRKENQDGCAYADSRTAPARASVFSATSAISGFDFDFCFSASLRLSGEYSITAPESAPPLAPIIDQPIQPRHRRDFHTRRLSR